MGAKPVGAQGTILCCEHLAGLLSDCPASVVVWHDFDLDDKGIPITVLAFQLYDMTSHGHPERTPLVILPVRFCPVCGREVKVANERIEHLAERIGTPSRAVDR